jgi:hypothetical protein
MWWFSESGYTAISRRFPPKISLTDFGYLGDILRGFIVRVPGLTT